MAKARIDYSEAEQLLRQGLTQMQVAEHFGVSQSAVSVAIARGLIKHDTKFNRWLPEEWVVRKAHTNRAIPRLLRIAYRIQAGDQTLSPTMRKQGEGFMRRLDRLEAVIHYEPEVEPFFFRVKRRPGIDEGLIRNPDVP